jgi:rhodanese-related sulfurtransferase
VLALLDAGAELWDVRREHEWANGNLARLGAIHVEAALIAERIAAGQLPRSIVVYCEHGPRSRAVADALTHAGVDATFLRGGIAALR